jgi:cation diffusion facilitator CzcD-associated flavoprotein CzcO
MMNVAERTHSNAPAEAQRWLASFAAALQENDAAAAAALFLADGLWRDLLAFTWTIETAAGRAAIEARLSATLARTAPANFHIPPRRTAPRWIARAGTECIETIFEFETALGPCHGIVRLAPDPQTSRLRAWTLNTNLQELRGHEEAFKRRVPEDSTRDFGAENWLDRLNKQRAYADRDPAVLVVGGGHAGLSIAARLQQLGVDTLIVDRHARIGDNWRTRYHSLTLHNEVFVNHLPYMPFPPNFPVYIPKDKLANWFETYVEALELNFWTGTELVSGSYDDARRCWTVTLKRDGGTRVMHPRHLIFATGVSSIPIDPDLPGLQDFEGHVVHSGNFKDAEQWQGRKALVVGTGTSGHDVAQELNAHGADVTIVQRSKTYVVSLPEAQSVYAVYSEGIPFDDCDLLATSLPYPVLQRSYRLSTAKSRIVDKELLEKLAARGFRLWFGEDETGFQMMYLRRGGGYYFNVGCSELIISGAVKLLQFSEVEKFVAEGARLRDGSVVPAELLVLATGYKNQQDTVRLYLGDAIADKIGPVWGFDEGGELRNMWRRTAQQGLWFTAGSLAQCRIFSRYLAIQIKALEEGILD